MVLVVYGCAAACGATDYIYDGGMCVVCLWCRNGNVIVHGGFDVVHGYMLVCSNVWIML